MSLIGSRGWFHLNVKEIQLKIFGIYISWLGTYNFICKRYNYFKIKF